MCKVWTGVLPCSHDPLFTIATIWTEPVGTFLPLWPFLTCQDGGEVCLDGDVIDSTGETGNPCLQQTSMEWSKWTSNKAKSKLVDCRAEAPSCAGDKLVRLRESGKSPFI